VTVTATVVVAGDDGALERTAPRSSLVFVDSLVERLHAEYGVAQDQIRAHATEVLATFATARVQTFVPILVEKALRQAYRASPRAAALW
jgi:hypothetical protein